MEIRLSHSIRSRCNGHGGGALGARMNLLTDLLDSFEDPEKILEQTVLEMNDDLTKMHQATAQARASQKRLENKYKAAQEARPLKNGTKEHNLLLGREMRILRVKLLNGVNLMLDNANTLKAQLDQQKNVVDNLVSNTRAGELSIGCLDAFTGQWSFAKACAQSAKTATKVSEMLGNVNTSSALSAFEKMEEKGKFALLDSSSVDDDLANLKKELSGSTKCIMLSLGVQKGPLGSQKGFHEQWICFLRVLLHDAAYKEGKLGLFFFFLGQKSFSSKDILSFTCDYFNTNQRLIKHEEQA
ncbi:unnamed protein product [Camellia sinensis]